METSMETRSMSRLRRQLRQAGLLGLAMTASTVLAGSQTKPDHPPVATDRLVDTYQIYSMLMPGQVFTDMDAGGPWAINSTTVNQDDMNPKLAPDAMLKPPDDNP